MFLGDSICHSFSVSQSQSVLASPSQLFLVSHSGSFSVSKFQSASLIVSKFLEDVGSRGKSSEVVEAVKAMEFVSCGSREHRGGRESRGSCGAYESYGIPGSQSVGTVSAPGWLFRPAVLVISPGQLARLTLLIGSSGRLSWSSRLASWLSRLALLSGSPDLLS